MPQWAEVRLNLMVFKMPDDFKQLIRVSGIYFLIKDGVIEYVGRSVNIGSRLTSHKVFDRYYYDEVWVYRYENKYMQHFIETELIHELKPNRNIAANG